MDAQPTFEDALQQYREERLAARNLAPKTRREYLADLRQACAFFNEDCGLTGPADVEKRHLEAFLADLDRRGLRGSSRRRKVASLKSFFSYLFDLELIPVDPTLKLIPPAREHALLRVLRPLAGSSSGNARSGLGRSPSDCAAVWGFLRGFARTARLTAYGFQKSRVPTVSAGRTLIHTLGACCEGAL